MPAQTTDGPANPPPRADLRSHDAATGAAGDPTLADVSGLSAVAVLARPRRIYPDAEDARFRAGLLFPEHQPKFKLSFRPGSVAFTIGSCFARNIEEELERLGLRVPTCDFRVPAPEFPYRPNGLLNEFNPGAMARRVNEALSGHGGPATTLCDVPGGVVDLLLPAGPAVGRERALQRRSEIAAVYSHLASAEVVIVTLGFIETWFDGLSGAYLNRMPPLPALRREPGRFEYRRLDVSAALAHLRSMMRQLLAQGTKIILTVSPVPIARSFEMADCVVGNEYSKAVLRVCAETLARESDGVDYFPSYEIVRSAGLSAYEDDHIHVRPEAVRMVVEHMIASYRP
jgi:hypothetical protein